MAAVVKKRQQPASTAAAARRWLTWLGMASTLIVLVAAGAAAYQYLSQPGRLPLRVIDINGELQQLRQAEIQQSVINAIDGGFFGCDMQALRAAVLAMPWVEDVSIRRVWPDKLSMTVTEQVPLARWGEDALINVNGGVFRPATLDGFAGLVKLQGPKGSERRVVDFFQSAVAAAHARQLQIREVELDERRHWWLRFDDGLTVSLGRESVEHRLAQFFRVYPSLAADPIHRPDRVDMRYAHGFAVRWREPVGDEAASKTMKSQGKV
ncbi:MAG: cell division protein FtsQ/DivIB [Chromatiaceae bacterium]|jgi:cell division protein FtsQ|nr:cell division protein FtsQ/DivIB [Chromatiaceae bacterium]